MKKAMILLFALILGLTTQAQMVGASDQRDKTTNNGRTRRLHIDSYQSGLTLDIHAKSVFDCGIGPGLGLGYRIAPALYAGVGAEILFFGRALPVYADLKAYLPLKRCALFIEGESGYAIGFGDYEGYCWGLYGGFNYRNIYIGMGVNSMLYSYDYYYYDYYYSYNEHREHRELYFTVKLAYSIPLKGISKSLYRN